MKRAIKIIIVLFFPLFINAKYMDIIKVRDLYYKATTNKTDAEIFLNTLQNTSEIKASLIEAYKGMAFMIKANFAFNPYYKLSYFVKGKGLLDNAIISDPKNVELRFLRYCVQTNAPVFLAYSSKITEDKTMLVMNYNQLKDTDLKARINKYMKTSKECTKEEKQIFK